jgi:hypothetical protein
MFSTRETKDVLNYPNIVRTNASTAFGSIELNRILRILKQREISHNTRAQILMWFVTTLLPNRYAEYLDKSIRVPLYEKHLAVRIKKVNDHFTKFLHTCKPFDLNICYRIISPHPMIAYALQNCSFDVCKSIIEKGVAINTVFDYISDCPSNLYAVKIDMSILHYFLRVSKLEIPEDIEICKLLIKHNANIYIKNKSGETIDSLVKLDPIVRKCYFSLLLQETLPQDLPIELTLPTELLYIVASYL